jgi:hypothetical protein
VQILKKICGRYRSGGYFAARKHDLVIAAVLGAQAGGSGDETHEALDVIGADRRHDGHAGAGGIGEDELHAVAAVELGEDVGERRRRKIEELRLPRAESRELRRGGALHARSRVRGERHGGALAGGDERRRRCGSGVPPGARGAERRRRCDRTLPSVTSTSTEAASRRTLKAVPTARTATPRACTTKGRAGFFCHREMGLAATQHDAALAGGKIHLNLGPAVQLGDGAVLEHAAFVARRLRREPSVGTRRRGCACAARARRRRARASRPSAVISAGRNQRGRTAGFERARRDSARRRARGARRRWRRDALPALAVASENHAPWRASAASHWKNSSCSAAVRPRSCFVSQAAASRRARCSAGFGWRGVLIAGSPGRRRARRKNRCISRYRS